MMKNQKGFSVIEGVFIILIAGVLGFTGWYVYNKQSNKNPQKTSVSTTQLQKSIGETGNSTYKNDTLGLSFSYPSRWGKAVTKTNDDEDRFVPASGYTEFDITFPNAPIFILPVVNNKNNYLVQYAGCFNSVGFLNFTKTQAPEDLKPGEWKQSETSPGNSYTTYSKVLIGNDETILIESFEVSTVVNPQDYCNGLSVYGSQEVKVNTKNLSQVQFLWSKTASKFGKDQPKLDLKDLEDFKSNPAKYISNEDLADLQTMVKSIKSY